MSGHWTQHVHAHQHYSTAGQLIYLKSNKKFLARWHEIVKTEWTNWVLQLQIIKTVMGEIKLLSRILALSKHLLQNNYDNDENFHRKQNCKYDRVNCLFN